MRMPKPSPGLRAKVTYGVLLPVVIVLALLSYELYAYSRRLTLGDLQRLAQSAGEIIVGGMQDAMLANDLPAAQRIVTDIAQQPGVQQLQVLDKVGRVVMSSDEAAIGTQLDINDPTCQACHQYPAVTRNEGLVVTLADGARVFRNVNVIENSPKCWACHDPSQPLVGVLVTDLSMADVDARLSSVRLITLGLSGGIILLVAAIITAATGKLVISRLRHVVQAVVRIDQGNLDERLDARGSDEISRLADAVNEMTDGLKEKERLEGSLKESSAVLQAQAVRLATLNTIAATVSQSLDLDQLLSSALDKVIELMDLRASWVVLHDQEKDEYALAAYRGLPQEIALAHVYCEWNLCICPETLDRGEIRLYDAGAADHPCPAVDYFREQGLAMLACVPLTSRDKVLGVMSLIGEAAGRSDAMSADTQDILMAIGQEIGIAIENATLYRELSEKEQLRKQLLERLMTVQEDERRRIARELHDQTGQKVASLIMMLRAFEEANPSPAASAVGAEAAAAGGPTTQDLRNAATQILNDVRALSLELRPSILDDLGLLAALRHYLKDYEDRYGLKVDLQVLGMEGVRLDPEAETALFRITQEALSNVARHARAHNVTVLLENRGADVMLIVEDDGQGFEVAEVMGAGPNESNLGLYGMRERASLLGGSLTIESTLGAGTSIFASLPLKKEVAA